MKFTTPCFVRVDNEESKARLISWILDIGNSYREDASGYIIACLGSRYENIHYAIPYSLVENLIDCGANVKLFKALAAMNDENAYMQYFVYRPKGYISHILGGWWLCTEQRWIDWAKPRFLNSMVFARKATAKEIIEHFKRGNL